MPARCQKRVHRTLRINPLLDKTVQTRIQEFKGLNFTNYLESLIIEDKKKGFRQMKKKAGLFALFFAMQIATYLQGGLL